VTENGKPRLEIINKTGQVNDTKVYLRDGDRRILLNKLGITRIELEPLTVGGRMECTITFEDPMLRLAVEHIWYDIAQHGNDRIEYNVEDS
jgi:hypothetical protein